MVAQQLDVLAEHDEFDRGSQAEVRRPSEAVLELRLAIDDLRVIGIYHAADLRFHLGVQPHGGRRPEREGRDIRCRM